MKLDYIKVRQGKKTGTFSGKEEHSKKKKIGKPERVTMEKAVKVDT